MGIKMKLGFSLLSLFMKDVDEMLSIAEDNGFDSVELLAEGPYRQDLLLGNKEVTEAFHSYDLDIYMHAVNVDINLASLNEGIRKESVKQTKQCLDLADEIGAIGVTAHPGKIGRPEKYLRDMALGFLTESTHELVAYAEDKEAKISIENMPERFSYL
jgi:sugar phosphate isomerase/epimerase